MVQSHHHVDIEMRVHAQDHLRGRLLLGGSVILTSVELLSMSRSRFPPDAQERTDVCAVTSHLTGASSYL
jgi:hypothetical protein